ncbi:MAG TPA: SRPBCC domain-containing protein [Longimicrobiales bacterium]|nr:SRPBCC domain-containing protein [Longimicrobiales bacterium]
MKATDGSIRWRLHLASPPERVYALLASPRGRARFWARSAEGEGEGEGEGGTIEFRFVDGTELRSRVLEEAPPHRFALTYFGGSTVVFELAPDGAGGTDLLLTETGVPEDERLENLAGWVSVLLALKAAADFGVDLRNGDPGRSWAHGYVDV